MNSSWQRIGRFIIFLVFAATLWLLYRELSQYDFQDVSRRMLNLPAWRVLAAVGLMIANYTVLVGYDASALRAIQRFLPWKRVAFDSFTGFVSSYNLSPLLGGSAVRYRLYSSWGLSAVELLQLCVMLGITFWVVILCLAGLVFLLLPATSLEFLGGSVTGIRILGGALCCVTAAFVGFTYYWRRPLRLRGTEVRLPDGTTTLLQIIVAGIDFLFTAGCLHVLIGEYVPLDYWQTLAVILLAMVTAVLSHVPGGGGGLRGRCSAIGRSGEYTESRGVSARVSAHLLPIAISHSDDPLGDQRKGFQRDHHGIDVQ